MEERKNVYLSLHKSFVREGIEYTDRATGEAQDLQLGDPSQGHRRRRHGRGRLRVQPHVR